MKQLYSVLVNELNLKNSLEFESILSWFEDDKIEYDSHHISFSHPSYYEALSYLLSDSEHQTTFDKSVFAHVLLYMANHGYNLEFVADSITQNYNRLPLEIRDKLLEQLKSSNMPTVKFYLAMCVEKNFEQLPKNLREHIISHVSDIPSAARTLTSTIVNKENEIDALLRNRILLKFCHIKESAELIAFHLIHSLNKFECELYQKLLKEIFKDSYGHIIFGRYIDHYYKRLSIQLKNDFLVRLSNSEFYKGEAGKLLLQNIKKESNSFEESLLNDLAKNTESSYHIARYLDFEKDKISSVLLEKILNSLSESNNSDTITAICKFLDKNFHTLELSLVMKIMDKIRLKEPAPAYLIGTILNNYNDLPFNIQNYIFEFIQNDDYKTDVLIRIAQHFSVLPKNIQDLLRTHQADFYSFLKILSHHNHEDKLIVLDIALFPDFRILSNSNLMNKIK